MSVKDNVGNGGSARSQVNPDKKSFFGNFDYSKNGALLLSLLIVGVLLTFVPEQDDINDAIEVFQPHQENSIETISISKKEVSENGYNNELETKLEDILQKIAGVGSVDVMITLSGSQEKILAEEIDETIKSTNETDDAGGNRVVQEENYANTIIRADDNMPYIIREDMPAVSGALIIAEGADNVAIKNAIIQSVSVLLDIPVHKVSVFKMGSAN
ncbi:hypothetical protein AN639_00795 [Candidatus Epulonipiscium fishelsonii]|uniref:Uncharacterized protein n=1 Tax=Candidatus Epulonipiscium fishelsonii TaxID=77094 RepID=A0ACC8X736_9FIRM|nr:hypothetical protein AN396_12360 [Epulopiscium sp. SCG-B11WGA-EpuloA1]ONI41335.1 hypothetical protein AN639_00795 [Epulopiscium sp. SCG-B05WGA-EpuloA1]